jgi:ATP-dependent helicase/nuclease subunit A
MTNAHRLRSDLVQDTPSRRQSDAADPLASRWVGASAGTGKTKVLVDRVLRLMLPRQGLGPDSAAPPEKILCITYTKAAAAEMSNRVYRDLAAWAVMPQDKLDESLFSLTGAAPDDDTRMAARRLFARTLDAPGGLKIMTVHSFCQSVLKRFPLEAGVAPHFEMMDEAQARAYMQDVLHDMIASAQSGEETSLATAFSCLAVYLNSEDMIDLLGKMVSKRHRLQAALNAGADKAVQSLYRQLGLEPGFDARNIFDAAAQEPRGIAKLRQAADALLQSSSEDRKKGAALGTFWALSPQLRAQPAAFSDYQDAFFKQDGAPFTRVATKAVQAKMPDIEEVLIAERGRVEALRDKLRLWRFAEMNAALLTVSLDLIARYNDYKRRTERLDFDDLIFKTAALLSDARAVSWVMFKLDEGIDHILVDEAQDTSPEQWRVIGAIAEEFFSGQGRDKAAPRTLFVVGDEKQSIFSFQGADPAAFARMQSYFRDRAAAVQKGFDVFLQHSFRSCAAVLQVVDAVFADPAVRAGVVDDVSRDIAHLAERQGQAGRVELWPIFRPHALAEKTPWELPVHIAASDDPVARLARHIAATIAGWIARGEKLPARDRPIRAGDIMILVQKRGALVGAVMRALKENGVPVAGIDRLVLLDDMGVQDVLALADVCLQPQDDLTLAGVLKSPFIGLSEDDLMTLSARRSQTLWAVLSSERPDIVDWLSRQRRRAQNATPYEFFAGLLAAPCPADTISGRRAVYARLGFAAQDPLEEFLNAALVYEQMNVPALQGFVHAFRQGQAEIKREQDQSLADQVRILTVHGSKGLQAPIVFLADAAGISYDHPKGRERLLWPGAPEDGALPLWSPRKEFDVPLYQTRARGQNDKLDAEYRRLLYVALTRAEDRLYIAGTQRKNAAKDACWHKIIERLFPASAQTIDFPSDLIGATAEDEPLPAGKLLDLPQAAPPRVVSDAAETALPRVPPPTWLMTPPVQEPSPPQPLTPSRPDDEDPAAQSPLRQQNMVSRYRRGTLIHRVLQFLPDVAPDRQDESLRRYLAQPGLGLAADDQNLLADEILRVLRDAEFAPIFSRAARAEVPLIGLAGQRVIAGQVDRLLVREKDILLVDYKTNRPPPRRAEDVSVAYLKQMAAYYQLLRNIYPRHHIRAALLWTDGPVLMPLSEKLLDPYMSTANLDQ